MTTSNNKTMILSLSDKIEGIDHDEATLVNLVGGKAAGLMKLYSIDGLASSAVVPRGFVLTAEFFDGWIQQVVESEPYKIALLAIQKQQQQQQQEQQEQSGDTNTVVTTATNNTDNNNIDNDTTDNDTTDNNNGTTTDNDDDDFYENWINPILSNDGQHSIARRALLKQQQAVAAVAAALQQPQPQPQPKQTDDVVTAEQLTRLCCDKIKEYCVQSLDLNQQQLTAIGHIKLDMQDWDSNGLAAVRSSTPDEDGVSQSFAGQYETKLGVSSTCLIQAVKDSFASMFDYRVFSYVANANGSGGAASQPIQLKQPLPKFACIVMEMVDSVMAGVAFSQNPINSDLDEMVVDCSYGLGESVVDGSVVADRYVYDKLGGSDSDSGRKKKKKKKNNRSGGGGGKTIEVKIGTKKQEKRLLLSSAATMDIVHEVVDDFNKNNHNDIMMKGNNEDEDNEEYIVTKEVDETRQKQRTLSDEQLKELSRLVCIIEDEYQMPMDVEFAFTTTKTSKTKTTTNNISDQEEEGGADAAVNIANDFILPPPSSENDELVIKLLQARPITTAFSLDKEMLTQPGEPRILYYDFNIASEATTTEPFTHLDLKLYRQMSSILMTGNCDLDIMPDISSCYKHDPKKALGYSASTRQYFNLSIAFRWFGPKKFAGWLRMLDPYLASTFESSDCDREKYRAKKCPKNINLRNAFWLVRQFPFWTMYKASKKYKSHPKQSKEEYIKVRDECLEKLDEVHRRGYKREEGLQAYIKELVATLMPSINEEMALIMMILLPTFHKIDAKRRDKKKSEAERQEYEALCGGYEGDPLMEVNIAMYQLARLLPTSIWSEYDHTSYDKLAERIQKNLNGGISDDIPAEFLTAWESFMKSFGYDGMPQLFVSSSRYIDHPEILLAMISHNVGDGIVDPASIQEMNVKKRRDAMSAQVMKRRWWNPFNKLPSIFNRNAILEHLMWIRNVPKMNLAQMMGMVREALLLVEAELLQSKRLEKPGDIFHLDIEEIDAAIMESKGKQEDLSPPLDLMELVKPRRAIYEKAKRATQCPILVDSRNRILRPDVPSAAADCEPGTLVGSAISPGVATGRLRIVHNPTDPFETGEVLAAIVTDPAWTPMFVGAAAVILQIGGVLQHGALCAREYGKPGVSCITLKDNLETGMMVSVDGNTGLVKILDYEDKVEENVTMDSSDSMIATMASV